MKPFLGQLKVDVARSLTDESNRLERDQADQDTDQNPGNCVRDEDEVS